VLAHAPARPLQRRRSSARVRPRARSRPPPAAVRGRRTVAITMCSRSVARRAARAATTANVRSKRASDRHAVAAAGAAS